MHLVLRRFAVVLLAVVLGCGFAAMTATGCGGPYSGPPEKIKRPKAKRRPKAKEGEAEAVVVNDKCRTNFFEKPTTKRKESQGKTLSKQAEGIILEAETQKGEDRLLLVKEALS